MARLDFSGYPQKQIIKCYYDQNVTILFYSCFENTSSYYLPCQVQAKIPTIFEIGLPPLLNSKIAETQLGLEEVTSTTQHVPTFACKVTGVRVRLHASEPSNMRDTLTVGEGREGGGEGGISQKALPANGVKS